MEKIFIIFFDMSTNLVAGGILHEIKELQPYYSAIVKIRETLEAISAKLEYKTGFKGWPTPNPFYYRTPKYMYLETAIFKNGEEKEEEEEIVKLYTPFGDVKLLSGGSFSEMLQISKEFLSTMEWELVEVTKTIKLYNYIQQGDRKFGPFSLKKETWSGAGTPTKLYLIQKVDDIDFISDTSQNDLVVFQSVILMNGQYEQDTAQFKELSCDENCF